MPQNARDRRFRCYFTGDYCHRGLDDQSIHVIIFCIIAQILDVINIMACAFELTTDVVNRLIRLVRS